MARDKTAAQAEQEEDRMALLAKRCEAAGWVINEGRMGYVLRPPKKRPFTIPLKAPDDSVYKRAEQQVLFHGLEAAEKEHAPKKAEARKVKLEADREKNDAKLAAAERRIAAQNAVAASVPVELPAPAAPPAAAPAAAAAAQRVPAAPFTPATALEKLGLNNVAAKANGNGHAPAAADPVDALFPGQVVPDVLRGVAGLSSLEPDTDLSAIIIDPADEPGPGPMQVTVYQLVTPEIAQQWLDLEIGMLPDGTMLAPRPIRSGRINKYTGILQRDIKAQREGRPGEWDVAEDLKRAPKAPRNTGGAINGRHRMTTIVETGISAIVKVTYNTAPRLYRSMDQGGNRSTADNLGTAGMNSKGHFGSAAKLLFCWRQWQLDPTGPYYNWRRWPRMIPTDAQLIDFLKEQIHPVTRDSLIDPHMKPGVNMMSGVGGIPASGIVFRIVVTEAWSAANPDGSHTMPEKGQIALEKFCTAIQHGWEMTYGNPADTARKWIEKGTGGVKRNEKREFQLNGLLRAWESFARGVDYKKMQVNEDGPMPAAYVPSPRTPGFRAAFGLPPRN